MLIVVSIMVTMLLLNVVSVFLPNIAIAVIMFRTGGHHDAHIDHSFYHGHCSNGVQDRPSR
jgi:hypothetical protein